jgi:hypothetical protein
MAAAFLWWARIPATSPPWPADIGNPVTLIPPLGTLIDVIPAVLAFGLGISLVVAPLTSTLMSSIAVRFAGVGSAINNAISRVGAPLLSAIIFIVVSGTFYATLGRVAGVDPASPEIRAQVQPINAPKPDTPPAIREAATAASTDAFHVASLVCAALLVGGAAVNFVGLRDEQREDQRRDAPDSVPAGPA